VPNRVLNVDLIRRSPFFAAAGEAAMERLLRLSFTQHLPRGAMIFEQQESADFLRLLLEGSVGLQAEDEAGQKTVVEIFGPGELFLAPAAILRMPYLVSGILLMDSRVLMIPAEPFRDGIATDPALARATIELLSRHWRLMVEQVVDLKLRSAERRVARFLARRVPEEASAGPVTLAEPRAAIAARLGMTPETLSRTLGAIEARGAIRLSPRQADVVDRAMLLDAASPAATRAFASQYGLDPKPATKWRRRADTADARRPRPRGEAHPG
jgi:CRP/FNR family transcriptional activator FtrB